MKKFFNFILWAWRKSDWVDRSMMLAAFLVGAALPLDPPMRSYILYCGLAIPMFWGLRFLFWVGPKSAWKQYNEEQEKMVELLKKDYSSDRRL